MTTPTPTPSDPAPGSQGRAKALLLRVKSLLLGAHSRGIRVWERLKSLGLRFSGQLKPFAFVCTAAFGIGTVARAVEVPNDRVWEPGHPLNWALVATGLVTAVSQIAIYLDRRRRKRKTALDDACRQIAAHIDDACPGLALRNVGVHVWVVAGPWFARRLERAGTFVLRERRSSAVAWMKGKGVFGLAWKRRAPAILDLQEHLYSRAHSREEFMALPEEDRLGLAWDELERTRQYKTIYAAPLFDRSATRPEIQGIVAVDILETGYFRVLYDATVGNYDFNAILGICEAAIR